MTSTNNKISNLVSSQLPAFVRDDNPLFVAFLEAYYEYLEQEVLNDTGSTGQGKVIERINSLKNYNNIEQTLDDFSNLIFNQFMQFIPQPDGTRIDFKKILPKIKDFYRAKGTEKSYKFLLRLLSNGSETDLFYPKDHILKPSDGKWFVQRSLRVFDTRLNGNLDSSYVTFQKYVGRELQGLTSNSTATVERADQFYELGTLVNEIFLTSISNTFTTGETVRTTYDDVTLTSNIFAGFVTSVVVSDGGTGYTVGTPLTFTGGGGTGAAAVVSSVSTGNISGLTILNAGSGYQQNNFLFFSGGGGTGANANVITVNTSGAFHPNTYNIDANQISQILSSNWRAAQTIFAISTSNLALNTLASIISTFTYANTGPIEAVNVITAGNNYTSIPSVSVVANSTVAALGILGSLIINNGGSGYLVNDELVFTNPTDGFGFGAKANVRSVNGTGAITRVGYYADPNEIPGGLGYFPGLLPNVTVTSSGGSGANITVVSPLSYGADLTSTTGAVGTILGVTLTSGGQNYSSAPSATIPDGGDGTAEFVAAVTTGVFTYPGYFLNQDGFPSAYNFLQDRDYWQNYSYVVRVGLAYEKWIQAVNNLLHPLGMKVWGEYAILENETLITENVSNPAIDSTLSAQQYYTPNAIYFDGSSYFKTMTETSWGSSDTASMLWSGWFMVNTDLPNTTSEMIIQEATNSNSAAPRFKVSLRKSSNSLSGTGVYAQILLANSTGAETLTVKTDESRTPIVSNVWYHLIWSCNVASVQNVAVFLNNVNSCIITANTANTTEKIWFSQMNVVTFGANSSGNSAFTGNIAEVWTAKFNSFYNISKLTNRDDWLSPPLLPNSSLTANGFGWQLLSQPEIYLRGNTIAGNTNSGSGSKAYRVTGNTIGLLPGPGHPSLY